MRVLYIVMMKERHQDSQPCEAFWDYDDAVEYQQRQEQLPSNDQSITFHVARCNYDYNAKGNS